MTRPDFHLKIRAFKYKKKEVVPMHATYGSRKRGGVAVPIFPCDSIISTLPNPKRLQANGFLDAAAALTPATDCSVGQMLNPVCEQRWMK